MKPASLTDLEACPPSTEGPGATSAHGLYDDMETRLDFDYGKLRKALAGRRRMLTVWSLPGEVAFNNTHMWRLERNMGMEGMGRVGDCGMREVCGGSRRAAAERTLAESGGESRVSMGDRRDRS